MKGIILAGGRATRLRPLTWVVSKQLLPVYDKPMIFYPLNTLIQMGIKDILVIISPENSGLFLNLLGTGDDFGVHFSYAVQKEPRGLPDAFIVGEKFINGDNVAMVLGDNIMDHDFSTEIKDFNQGGLVFAKEVTDPQRYGVAEFDQDGQVLSLEEKPVTPKSNYAIIGLYVFDKNVSRYAKELQPSVRGEIEIIDLQKKYLAEKQLHVKTFTGYWQDAGTFDSLLEAGNYMAKIASR